MAKAWARAAKVVMLQLNSRSSLGTGMRMSA